MMKLEADSAILEVTPPHRIAVPNAGSSQDPSLSPGDYKLAKELREGDPVLCDGTVKHLTKVTNLEMDLPVRVYQLRFKPDLPVVVFSTPTHVIASRGGEIFMIFKLRLVPKWGSWGGDRV